MTIDTNLYNAIESNNNIKDKAWFNNNLQFAKEIYNVYGVEYTFDNIINIVKNIKIIDGKDDEIIQYDYDRNILVLGKSQNNMEFNLCKSFLQITSQNYNVQSNINNNGLIYKDENGIKYGKKLNDLLISELITINTGLSQNEIYDENLTPINSIDTIIRDLLSITNANKLVTYFAFAQGDRLFENISNIIGIDNAKKFYNSIDNYDKNLNFNTVIYNMCINAIMNSMVLEEHKPKM